MQLQKQKIRNAPTYNEKLAPRGIRRQDGDFNQVNNHAQRIRNARGDSFAAPTEMLVAA